MSGIHQLTIFIAASTCMYAINLLTLKKMRLCCKTTCWSMWGRSIGRSFWLQFLDQLNSMSVFFRGQLEHHLNKVLLAVNLVEHYCFRSYKYLFVYSKEILPAQKLNSAHPQVFLTAATHKLFFIRISKIFEPDETKQYL